MVDPGGAKESDDVYAALGIRFLLVTYMNCKNVVEISQSIGFCCSPYL